MGLLGGGADGIHQTNMTTTTTRAAVKRRRSRSKSGRRERQHQKGMIVRRVIGRVTISPLRVARGDNAVVFGRIRCVKQTNSHRAVLSSREQATTDMAGRARSVLSSSRVCSLRNVARRSKCSPAPPLACVCCGCARLNARVGRPTGRQRRRYRIPLSRHHVKLLLVTPRSKTVDRLSSTSH